jgi:isopenicillin N synthase-like dioxygenase
VCIRSNYPHQDQEPGKDQIRASPHTDYGSLTILAVDDAPGGLQVMDHDGKWHDVKAPAGSYVVNLGDLMQHWTNDEWRSTMHRVINPPAAKGDNEDEPQRNNRRQSIAFFHNINGDVLVECFPSCQSPEHPSKYAPVLAGEYLMMKHEAAMGRKK